MSRRHRVMRSSLTRTAQIIAGFAAVLALAGCGAGLVTQTDSQVAAVDGAYANLGPVALRDVLIPYPDNPSGTYPLGSTVPLQLTMVNQGDLPETLVSVRTPAASQVLVLGTTTVPPGKSVTTIPRPVSGAATAPSTLPLPLPSSETPAVPTTAASGTASATPESPLDVGLLHVVLVTTTQPLRAGQNVEITFVFRHAGQVTLPVPMASPDSGRSPLTTATRPVS